MIDESKAEYMKEGLIRCLVCGTTFENENEFEEHLVMEE